jgi:hypothetical protein
MNLFPSIRSDPLNREPANARNGALSVMLQAAAIIMFMDRSCDFQPGAGTFPLRNIARHHVHKSDQFRCLAVVTGAPGIKY